MESEASHFIRLFSKVLDYVYEKSETKEEDITASVQRFIEIFNGSSKLAFDDIDFEKADNVCGYLHRYAPLHAGLVRNKFRDALNNCDKLRLCLRNLDVNVVALGGGPGNDLIGLCSALYEHELEPTTSVCNSEIKNLNLTVVDRVQRWSSCFNIMEFLIREDDFGNTSKLFKKIDVVTSFIRVNLPGSTEVNARYFKALREADIILISRILSVVPEEKKRAIINSISKSMKPDALLLLIDTRWDLNLFHDFSVIHHSTGGKYEFPIIKERFGVTNSPETVAAAFVFSKKFS